MSGKKFALWKPTIWCYARRALLSESLAVSCKVLPISDPKQILNLSPPASLLSPLLPSPLLSCSGPFKMGLACFHSPLCRHWADDVYLGLRQCVSVHRGLSSPLVGPHSRRSPLQRGALHGVHAQQRGSGWRPQLFGVAGPRRRHRPAGVPPIPAPENSFQSRAGADDRVAAQAGGAAAAAVC